MFPRKSPPQSLTAILGDSEPHGAGNITRHEFERMILMARHCEPGYATGYKRGLRRLFQGNKYGTLEQHRQWMAFGTGDDPQAELGQGYRDGFAGKMPKVEAVNEAEA